MFSHSSALGIQSWTSQIELSTIFDLEVVEKGLEVVLGCEACIEQEALDARPFTETSIVEHLQVVGDDEGDDSSR